MKILFKSFEITCPLAAQVVIERIENLLLDEGVKFSAAGFRITSTRTPIVVFGVQPKLYTRRNWVGLNPFTFVSGVDVSCESRDAESATRIIVRINRRRSILWVAFWVLCGFLVGRAMPQPGGAVVFAAVVLAAWFGNVSFMSGYLVKKEILDVLKA